MIVAINIIVFAFFLFILSDPSRSSGSVTQMIERLMRKLLGKGEDSILENEEWKGRVNYITNEMQRMNMETLQEAKVVMKDIERSSRIELNELEKRLNWKLEKLYTRVEEMMLSSVPTT
jgi:sensor histidine kinase YesM